jgi:hypothetical protein
MMPKEPKDNFIKVNSNFLNEAIKKGQKRLTVVSGKSKRIKNQDIIDFRYWLINQMYPGSVPETSSTSFIAGERRVGQDAYEKAVFEEVLMQFNNHFGVRGYDIG